MSCLVYYFDKLLGICHTDIHMIDNDWGMSRYPLVPGHEIVGRVIGVGSAITNIKEGESNKMLKFVKQ